MVRSRRDSPLPSPPPPRKKDRLSSRVPFLPFPSRRPPNMGKRSPDPISTGQSRWSRDALPGPTSPLERSPKGWRTRESQGVGLGIVVALEKSSSSELSSKVVVNFPRALSPPVPISAAAATGRASRIEVDDCGGKRTRRRCNKQGLWEDGCGRSGLFYTSPPGSADEFSGFPVSGFLNSCHLCRKKLDGRDIYMYRGENAFCSVECRYRQIVADEYKESCGHVASRPSDNSTSIDGPGQRLLNAGIMAA